MLHEVIDVVFWVPPSLVLCPTARRAAAILLFVFEKYFEVKCGFASRENWAFIMVLPLSDPRFGLSILLFDWIDNLVSFEQA